MVRLRTGLAWLISAGSVLSWQAAQTPHGMFCGGNQLVDMGSLRAASVTGTVEDPTGATIPRARVQLQVQGSGKLLRNIEADGKGQFRLSHLRPGMYWLGISSPGFNLHFWRLNIVRGGHSIKLRAELSAGT